METNGQSGRVGTVFFAIGFLVFSLILLSLIGAETRYSAKGQLFAQPRTWPLISISGMVIFGTAFVAANWRGGFSQSGREALIWIRSLEFLGWFMAYVFAVAVIGYLPMTVLFTTALAFRLGYRGRTLLLAALMGVAIVLIFKAGLAVKIPGGQLYEYLPDAIRNFMIVNL